MQICIVAAGLASRLQPLTNYIPKFLINTGKQTGFVEMINYWKQYSHEFTIIVHPRFVELTRAYFELYFKNEQIELTILPCETALGTAHTIDTTLGMDYEDEEIIFTWCDIIPSEPIDLDELEIATMHGDGIAAFTVANGQNRYQLYDGSLIKAIHNDGDIVGLYYVEKYKQELMKYSEGDDFADVLSQHFVNEYPLEDIIDFGDKPKLFEVLKKADEGREFNSIELMEKFVHKKALNQQGKDLIKREIAWYEEIFYKEVDIPVPKIYPGLDDSELLMERIDGVAIYKRFPSLTHSDQSNVLCELFDKLNHLHGHTKIISNSVVMADVKKEAHDKLLSRYAEIKDVIDAFGKNIKIVNGYTIERTVEETIDQLHQKLAEEYKARQSYSLIHGDLQMSNSMIDGNLKISIIDPRGYFGNTQMYGLGDYDFAKLLYSITGYDVFNYSQSFHIKSITDTSIDFDIPPLIEDYSCVHRFKHVHFLWLAVIWIGLAQYIKNNPVKSVAAHYHGLALANKILDGKFIYG